MEIRKMDLKYTGRPVIPVPPVTSPGWIETGAELGRIAVFSLESRDGTLPASPPTDFEIDSNGSHIYDLLCHLHHLADRLGLDWSVLLREAHDQYLSETERPHP